MFGVLIRDARCARRAAREMVGLIWFGPGVGLSDSANPRAVFFDAFSVVIWRLARELLAARRESRPTAALVWRWAEVSIFPGRGYEI